MKHLPTDVLILIFNFLIQRDKLECMTVCKQWHDIIHHYCSFPVVYIDRVQQIQPLYEKTKSDPIFRTKLVELTFSLRIPSNFDMKSFAPIFRNLRYLALLSTNIAHPGSESIITKYENHPWCKHIETMIENLSDFNTNVLLHSGLCNNLTYIVVHGEDKTAYRLIKALANAPALKKLYLTQYYLTFHNLELLHTNTPQLESLILENVYFESGPIPTNIKPATLMKCFRCLSYEFNEFTIYNPHLLYIREKYTQLEELGINLTQLNFDRSAEAPQRQIITSLFKKLSPHLKTLSLSLDGYDSDWMSGGFDLNILDECGCQIKNLEVGFEFEQGRLYALGRLNQVNYIESLTANNIYSMDEAPMSFDWLLPFKKLKELSLQVWEEVEFPIEREMNLYDLLMNLINIRLETLLLYELDLTLSGPHVNITYPWLKDITLSKTTLPVGADAFLSRSFPNLKRLKLEDCFKSGDSFKLPNTDLSYLEIINKNLNGDFPIALTTLHNNQSRLYYSHTIDRFVKLNHHDLQNDIFTSPAVSSVPLDTAKDKPMLTIVCRSVINFLIKNSKV